MSGSVEKLLFKWYNIRPNRTGQIHNPIIFESFN